MHPTGMQAPRQTIVVQALLRPPPPAAREEPMDEKITPGSITADSLNALATAFPPPLIIDVRRTSTFATASRVIKGAIRRDPALIADWADALEIGRRVVVYCFHGLEI